MASADLGNQGTLWTWTVQSFMPKTPYHTDETPETFRPYGVGVELAWLKVESRLKENTPEELKIGMPMKLEIISVRKDDDGNDLLTFILRRRGDKLMDVAIVGLGMHPFGRTPSMSGLEQGSRGTRRTG